MVMNGDNRDNQGITKSAATFYQDYKNTTLQEERQANKEVQK